MIVITCIKPETLRRIIQRGEATLELTSHQNVSAAEELRPGDIVFIARENEEDLRRGVEGIVVRVERVNVDYVRTDSPHEDEWEKKRARIRVSFIKTARVNQVARGRVITANVDTTDHFIIG